MPKKDIILGSVSIGFGAWIFYIANGLKKKAAFWPKIVAAGIIILGIIILVMGILNLRKQNNTQQSKKITKEQANYLRVAAIVGLMIVFYFVFKYVSYILAALILMIGTSVVLGYRNWKVLIPTAVIISVGLYAAFSQLFNVHFPGAFF